MTSGDMETLITKQLDISPIMFDDPFHIHVGHGTKLSKGLLYLINTAGLRGHVFTKHYCLHNARHFLT